MLNEPNLDMHGILNLVADVYSLDTQHVEFVPKGEVAWSYKITDHRECEFLLRIAPGAPAVSMASIEKLEGLDFVITPVDNLIVEHGSYSLSLYEFVAGETMWERTPSAVQLEVAGRSFAQLHRTVR
jgi:aminoglycoside phosphotransferase (APT) family kinase protein